MFLTIYTQVGSERIIIEEITIFKDIAGDLKKRAVVNEVNMPDLNNLWNKMALPDISKDNERNKKDLLHETHDVVEAEELQHDK